MFLIIYSVTNDVIDFKEIVKKGVKLYPLSFITINSTFPIDILIFLYRFSSKINYYYEVY